MDIRADKISEAEAEVMKIVWEHDGPVTYSRIRTGLACQKGWESPTVNTLVNRLVKKGVLLQEKKEVYYYSAAISEEEYMREKTESFVKKVYRGNIKGLISALLHSEGVTPEDLEELRRHWEGKGKPHE